MDKTKDMERFLNIMNGMVYNFGGTIDKGGTLFQFEALKEYSIEQVGKAAVWLLKNRKERFMPTIAEFIEVIEGKHEHPDIKSIANVQAEIAVKILKAYGRFQKDQRIENPLTSYIMKSKNYKKLANEILEKDFVWFKKEFIEDFISLTTCGILKNKTDFLDYKTTKKIEDLKKGICEVK